MPKSQTGLPSAVFPTEPAPILRLSHPATGSSLSGRVGWLCGQHDTVSQAYVPVLELSAFRCVTLERPLDHSEPWSLQTVLNMSFWY